MNLRALAVVLAVVSAVSITAQTPTPRFELASVKRSPPTEGGFAVSYGVIRGNVWTAEFALLPSLIRYAYFPQYQQPEELIGGPAWLESDRFHITARIAGPRDEARARVMAQALLAERFGLRVHRETRVLPVWDLTLARRDRQMGPRLQPVAATCEALLADERRRAGQVEVPLAMLKASCVGGMTSPSYAEFRSPGVTMGDFAAWLTRATKRTVVDRTGLSGAYAIELRFTMNQPLSASPTATPATATANAWADASLVGDALREELGLRLEERRAPTEVLVIDSVRPPTEN